MYLDAKTLQKIHRLTSKAWAEQAKATGLTQSEFDYLSAVQEQADLQRFEDHHGQHLQDIVVALGVSKASASTMISKLEKQGLVERMQCLRDARAQHIILTAQGQMLLAQGNKIYDAVAKKIAVGLG